MTIVNNTFLRVYLDLPVFSGTLGIMSFYSRPQVSIRLHARREAEMGRYHSMNLLTAEWIEAMMDHHKTEIISTYREIRDNYLLHNIY